MVAVADLSAAMHGDAGRFVDNDQVRILEQNPALELFQQARRWLCLAAVDRLQLNRRDAYHIAGHELVLGLAALPVDAHLTLSNDAIDTRSRHVLQVFDQEIVESLSQLRGADLDRADPGFLWLI